MSAETLATARPFGKIQNLGAFASFSGALHDLLRRSALASWRGPSLERREVRFYWPCVASAPSMHLGRPAAHGLAAVARWTSAVRRRAKSAGSSSGLPSAINA